MLIYLSLLFKSKQPHTLLLPFRYIILEVFSECLELIVILVYSCISTPLRGYTIVYVTRPLLSVSTRISPHICRYK
jgi:hypothetical protein